MLLPLPLSVFYLYHLDFDADADARCGYSLNFIEITQSVLSKNKQIDNWKYC